MHTVDRTPRQVLPPMSVIRLTPARRILDVAFATALLLLLAPLLALLALLVRTTSGRPVLFRQLRIGEGWSEFTLYKFRSMTNGSDGPGVTGGSDPRVTAIGRLLRRLSLDELPQLWNVLRGDMTLVGPRPEVPDLARRYPPDQQWVFRHRPGLTGPCQLRSRAFAAQIDGCSDPEEYYLRVLVPQRTAMNDEFLCRPTVPNVVRFTVRTGWYVLSAVWEGAGPGEAHGRRESGRRVEGGGS